MKTQIVWEKVSTDMRSSHPLGIHPNSFISRDSYHNIDEDIHACFRRLKQLVPAARLNARLSKVQLLQQVIDYILDLESTLDTKPVEIEKRCDKLENTGLTENGRTRDGEGILARCDTTTSNSRQPLAERAFYVNLTTLSSSHQPEDGRDLFELS